MQVQIVDNRGKKEYSLRAFGYEVATAKVEGKEYNIIVFADAIEIVQVDGGGQVFAEILLKPVYSEAIKLLGEVS